jgi:hypothetical protein
MVGLVVLLWTCGMHVMLPPRLANQPDKNWERQQFVEGWLEQRMEKRPQNGSSKSSGRSQNWGRRRRGTRSARRSSSGGWS